MMQRYAIVETARRRFLTECLNWGGVVPLGYLSVSCDASSPDKNHFKQVATTGWVIRNPLFDLLGIGAKYRVNDVENNSLHEANAISDSASAAMKLFRMPIKAIIQNDNSSAVEFLISGKEKGSGGSGKDFNETLERFCAVKSHFSDLLLVWIPRDRNEAADFIAGADPGALIDVKKLARTLMKNRMGQSFFPRYWSLRVTQTRERETCPGQKKKLPVKLSDEYSAPNVEQMWYDWWKESGYFNGDSNSSKPAFSIVHPPPNLTGVLHIGHALTLCMEDILVRWRRMSGCNTLFVPGTRHEGEATEFCNWADKNKEKIAKQSCRIGASFDWSREFFTLDHMRSKAVIEAFVRLYDEGLIYRDSRFLNWVSCLRTSISDIEVTLKHLDGRTLLEVPGYKTPVEFGVLTSFAYPLEGGREEIIVSTTRLETMLGDAAIAVHPDDVRYTHLHHKVAIHPFSGRRIPIVCDAILADPGTGTGAVKITPAHDLEDFEAAKRHQLEVVNIFTDDGKINSSGGHMFAGMPRFEARVSVAKALKQKGLHRGDKSIEMNIRVCTRSNDIVELLLKPQWYVDCTSMVNEALDAVLDEGNRKIEVLPKRYEAEWKRWFENCQDWCISRQLSLGHRVPAWYVTLKDDKLKELGAYSDRWLVCRSVEDAQAEAQRRYNGKEYMIAQDPDVLDTCFPSAILPLSVLGWPDKTDDLNVFYPTSVLVTGHDNLFSWVAPMVMLCSKLGGDVPFRKLYLHHLINDSYGHKISKASGNIVDPLDFIGGMSNDNLKKKLLDDGLKEKKIKTLFPKQILPFGADSFRFGLIVSTDQSGDIKFDIRKFISDYRGSCLVVWKTALLAMSILGDNYLPPTRIDTSVMPFSCQWILSVLNRTVEENDAYLSSFELSQAAIAVRSWWRKELSDFIKLTELYSERGACASERDYDFARATLWVCLDVGLRLMHIFMPYVTEELWQRLPQARDTPRKESIMSGYPSPVQSWTNESAEREMVVVLAFTKYIKLNLEAFTGKEVFLFSPDEGKLDIIRRRQDKINKILAVLAVKVLEDINDLTPEHRPYQVTNNLTIYA